MRTLAVVCLIACAALAAPSASSAKTLVGIGEQNADSFQNQLFKDLKFKRARVLAPWNVAQKRRDRRYLDNWLLQARGANIEPLVHFSAATGSRCPSRSRRRCRLPTVRQYTRAFRAFRRRWPQIRTIGVWNEANHRSQPTFKNPRRAAQYFNAVRRRCRGCRIVAADIIDEANMGAWLRVFKRYARGERLWGLHNYRDTNPRRGQIFGGTRRMLRLVRGQVWLTETGGIVKFTLPNRRRLFRTSPRRANSATKRMFRLARRYRRRIKRLYIYNFRAPIRRARFDAGLVSHRFIARPAYFTVKNSIDSRYFRP